MLLPNIKVMCLHHKISGKNTLSGYSNFSPCFSSSTVLLSFYFSYVSQVAVTYNVFLFLIDIVDWSLGTKLISQTIAPLLVGSVHTEYFF